MTLENAPRNAHTHRIVYSVKLFCEYSIESVEMIPIKSVGTCRT